MLDGVKSFFKTAFKVLKITVFVFGILSCLLSILLPVISIISGSGLLVVNIILASVAFLYLIFYIITHHMTSRAAKTTKSAVKKATKIIKLTAKMVSTGITIYGICLSILNANFAMTVVVIIMSVVWLVQIVFEILFLIVKIQVEKIVKELELKKKATELKKKATDFAKDVKKKLPGSSEEKKPSTPNPKYALPVNGQVILPKKEKPKEIEAPKGDLEKEEPSDIQAQETEKESIPVTE